MKKISGESTKELELAKYYSSSRDKNKDLKRKTITVN